MTRNYDRVSDYDKDNTMHKSTEEAFARQSKQVLGKVSKRYDIDENDLTRLGSFESFVHEFHRNGSDYILRITPGSHRESVQISGELEWVNYLADNNVGVSRAVPSKEGRLAEVVSLEQSHQSDETFYTVVVFEKAPGRLATKDDWNDALFTNWGRMLGQMHALTKSYQPSDPSFKRPAWHEDSDLNGVRHIPTSQVAVIEKHRQMMAYFKSLPTNIDSYGLVHEDMHHGNFFVDKDRITVFDFDDCQYHWFAADISIPLFYVMRNKRLNKGTPEFARSFMGCLLEGYSRENNFDKSWLDLMPRFLKLREMILYIIIHYEQAHKTDEWCREFMDGRQNRIENDIPVIDIDFTRLG